MGKGDRKTRKGKIAKNTFGVRRPKKTKLKVADKNSKKSADAMEKTKK